MGIDYAKPTEMFLMVIVAISHPKGGYRYISGLVVGIDIVSLFFYHCELDNVSIQVYGVCYQEYISYKLLDPLCSHYNSLFYVSIYNIMNNLGVSFSVLEASSRIFSTSISTLK